MKTEIIKNRGLSNEQDICNQLNNKKVCEINPNLKTMLRRIFGPIDDDQIIRSEQIEGTMKPDLKITYKSVTKYVSIKSGHACFVHEEQVSTLIPFLNELGYAKTDVDIFLTLLYRDGTTNGLGEKSLEFIESRVKNADLINEFNKIFNSKKENVERIINRCLFTGAKDTNIPAEFIYFGNANFGVVCSKTQIQKHINRRTWDYMHNPHIGPLQFRAHSFDKTSSKRHQCDFWWARLREDLEYIEERYWG